MTKVIFVGDPHFKVKNAEHIPLFISRVQNISDSFAPDFVVIAGDILDNHDKIDVEPLNLALNFITSISQKHKTFLLVGNHDYKNNQQFLSDHHWMNAIKQWNNVVVVDTVTQYTVNTLNFLFLPYVPPGRFLEAIKTSSDLTLDNVRCIFAHQEFYGCKMGAIESKLGDNWDETWPLVISGHIHDKQWSQKNIYYPGSAMQHAFGQSSENTISSIQFFPDKIHIDEIDLEMPKLTIRYIDVESLLETNQKPLKFKNTELRKYKLVLQGTPEQFHVFKKNAKYKQLLDEGFKITFKIKNNVTLLSSKEKENSNKKFMQILEEHIKNENDPELEHILHSFVC